MKGLKERKESLMMEIYKSAANDFHRMAFLDESEYRFSGSHKVTGTAIVTFLYKFDKLAEEHLWFFIINIRSGVDPSSAVKTFVNAIDKELPDNVLEFVDELRASRCGLWRNHEALLHLNEIIFGLLKINLVYNQKLQGIEDDIYEDDEEKYLWSLLTCHPNIGDTIYQHFQGYQN